MAYIGKSPIIGNFVKLDAITAVNGQAAYTMQNGGSNFTDYESVNQFLVSLNGTIQAPTDSFTVSGSTLTFASNLATGDVIDFVMVFGNSLSAGTPTDATVSTAKIINGAVTNDKVASSIINSQTAETSIADADEVLIYDSSASALRKMTKANFVSGVGGDNTPYFEVRKTSDQNSINHNTLTKVTFDTEDLDSDSAFASDKFTVPSGEGGKYFIFAAATLAGYATSKLRRVELFLYKNGSAIKQTYTDHQANDAAASNEEVSGVFDLSASDYIEVYARIRSSDSGNGNYIQGTTKSTFFSGFKIIG